MSSSSTEKLPPLISVVMPVFNSEEFLPAAIESILNQTLKDFEFIIVYDQSDDDSLEVIRSYQSRDWRINLIIGDGKGLVSALNKGFESARGRYIARMDADDISLPLRFECQVQLMEQSRADICGCHYLIVNKSGKSIAAKFVPLNHHSFVVCLAYTIPFAHGSVMMRASFLKDNFLTYDSKICAEDYDLWTRFYAANAVFANVDKILFMYREQSSSLSKRVRGNNNIDSKLIRRRHVFSNLEDCIESIEYLRKDYSNLTQSEEIYLILATLLVYIVSKNMKILSVIRQSSKRSLGASFYHILHGL